MTTAQGVPKHEQVRQVLEREIRSGLVKPGERLASEAELVERFGVSRITVGRAVRELQRAGLVERRAGSGTYVRQPTPAPGGLSFGLLIPDLGETEIFEPICQGMMASPLAREHALLWGSPARPGDGGGAREERTWQLCEQYIQRKADGVFFAPLERTPSKDETNRRVVEALEAARIPIVLLDRPVLGYPGRGGQDLVGIDNARAGYLITDHLLRMDCRRIAFVAVPDSAATVDMRESGYREAHHGWGLPVDRSLSRRFDPAEAAAVAELMATQRPDGIVCANDWTAARLMHTLLDLGHAVPDDVRIVGIDDVEYAKLLPVPLTTFRQPTREIGAAALAAMLERVAHPELPPRDILLHGRLVVRRSCGAPD
ncbi:MAG TPA: GntR family transcriptional regulator [Longimicrobiales bacterium]|nr:GntR family transcriptional regulator [Longimicrobiales bacterium]